MAELLDRLAGVSWPALALALAFHIAALAARAQAWRAILAATFAQAPVPYRGIFGAYATGVGANSVVPARLGDVLKLFLARRQVTGSSYPALVSSLVVITFLDVVIALGFVLWAVSTGRLPGLATLVSDAGSLGERVTPHPAMATATAAVAAAGLVIAVRLARHRLMELARALLRGLCVVRDWRFYGLRVVPWQAFGWALQLAAFWCFLEAFGLSASLERAALVGAVQSVAIAVPFTASGAGAEQALLVLVLKDEFGAAAPLAFAIGMRLAIIAANVLLAAAAGGLLLRTWRLGTLLRGESELRAHLGSAPGVRFARLRPR
jgi:uncharacterized membrane protein YbhN (UPF0104 family)